MSTSWDVLVRRLCPPGTLVDERVFRMPRGDAGTLRSGLYAGRHPMTRIVEMEVPRYILAWVLRGAGGFRDHKGRRHGLRPGSCFQRFPGYRHGVWFDDWDASAFFFVGLPAAFEQPLALAGLGSVAEPVFDAGCDVRLLRRAASYHDALQAAREEDLGPSLAEAFAIVCQLHRAYRRRQCLELTPWLDLACELLREDRQDLSSIARACGLGVSTFRQQFTAATGLSPVRWRIQERMRRAQDMLASDDSLAVIARKLGYPSVQSFSRQFHKEIGQPPGSWRQLTS